MKLSYNWLKEFVDLDITPQKLAELFTLKVAEVEEIEEQGQDLSKVVVGEILEIRPHPSADKVQITKISIGSDILEIVCGAKNIKVGQKVPTALVGAVLPGNFKISERKIRGVKSEGMLASAKELGLVDDKTGILILDPGLEPGDKVAETIGLADTILEVDVLPDRSYLLSHIGAARDIAAMRKSQILLNNYGAQGAEIISKSKIQVERRVQLMDPTLAPRYSMIKLAGLKIGPSPAWLAVRLQYLGVRPVNNLVDLTNYVMLELGQPLHAFDQSKLAGNRITVRSAKEGESIQTIDGETKKLVPGMVVIADEKSPIAIGGIMGGKQSEISEKTSEAILEAANFDSVVIRKTAQKLKMRSEASLRFERGVDPNLTTVALARLIELLPKVGLADVKISQLVDEYPAPVVRQPIRYTPGLVEKITGIKIETTEQIRLLQSLGLSINESVQGNAEDLLVTPPSYRNDLNIPVDLVEEIIRLYGYNKIPITLPRSPLTPHVFDTTRHWSKKTKNILRGAGFTEIETYSFANKKELQALHFDPRAYLELENPPTADQSFLRGSLLPNALAVVKKNIANGVGPMRFYELGRTYRLVRGEAFPFEGLRLLVVEVSKFSFKHGSKVLMEWNHLGQIMESMIFHFGLSPDLLSKKKIITTGAYHHGRAANLSLKKEYIGDQAEIHPIALSRLNIDRRVTVLDLDFDRLVNLSNLYHTYKPVPTYPAIVRDISMLIDDSFSLKEIIDTIKKSGGPSLDKVELFDKYIDERLSPKKSVAFHLSFRSGKKTLRDKEVEPVIKKIASALTAKNIKIRS